MSPMYDRGDHSSLARAPHSDLPTPPQHGTMTGDIKAIFQSFLARLEYRDPHTMPNASLRADITADIVAWKAGLSAKMIDGLTDTACTLVETMFPHTDYAHQRLICLYTTYIVYIDDLGNRDPEALARFGQRVAARESLGDPVLERLAGQFRDMYDMYPSIGADCINAATLGGVAGNHVELTTEHMDVSPGALRYPSFVRGLTGYAAAYAFFNFVQGWRDPADGFYLQVVPELVFCTNHINDILSFYKETLDGETNSYIHLRAKAENVDALVALSDLCEETADTIRRIGELTSSDRLLADICRVYIVGNVDFHFRAVRYRLADLQLEL